MSHSPKQSETEPYSPTSRGAGDAHITIHSQSGSDSPGFSLRSLSISSIAKEFRRRDKTEMLITLLTEALHVLFVLSFYDFVKINIGGGRRGLVEGYYHALHVIKIEQSLGAFFEASLQELFLPFHTFLRFWNLYYVVGHFVVSVACILFLAAFFPKNYQKFRNVFFWMNIVGVFFYAVYPLMPPRLVAHDCLQKPCPNYGFVDTLADERYAISLNPTKAKSANSYAAMPSMHIGWALCVGFLGLYPLSKKMWVRTIAVLYPLCMVYCIIITANHFWLDALGGLTTFMVTFAVLQYYPGVYEYGHGAHKGHDNDHYASWVSIFLASGVFVMNPVMIAKVAALVMWGFFMYRCIKYRIIPFVYKREGRVLPN